MRWYLFVSMASAAESFRSICNSERSAPECRRQRCPAATPQVGQGTEDNCAGVRSFILIETGCDKECGKTIRFGTLSGKTVPRGTHILPKDSGRLPGPLEGSFWRIWQLFGGGGVELNYEGVRR